MTLYVVTTKSEERNISGVLLRATCNLHGIYTSESLANSIADKYHGYVSKVSADDEHAKMILQAWTVNL